jgi:hypothetical protein
MEVHFRSTAGLPMRMLAWATRGSATTSAVDWYRWVPAAPVPATP